jgi:hypothetical protein
MSKGKIIAFRLSDALHKYLLQVAETQGCTISDVARNIITEHIEGGHILRALEDHRKALSRELALIREEISKMRTGGGAVKQEYPSILEYKKSLSNRDNR